MLVNITLNIKIMIALMLIGTIILVLCFWVGLIALMEDDNLLLYRILLFVSLLGAALLIAGSNMSSYKDGIRDGRIEGAKHPERLQIKSIDYETNDTTYVFRTYKVLEE